MKLLNQEELNQIENSNLHQGYMYLDDSIDTLSLLGDDSLLEFELDDCSKD